MASSSRSPTLPDEAATISTVRSKVTILRRKLESMLGENWHDSAVRGGDLEESHACVLEWLVLTPSIRYMSMRMSECFRSTHSFHEEIAHFRSRIWKVHRDVGGTFTNQNEGSKWNKFMCNIRWYHVCRALTIPKYVGPKL